jgi:hypothetical protein
MGASQRHRLGNRRVGRPRDPAGHCDSTRWPRHPAALTRAPRPHLREGIALRFSSPLGSSRDERRGGVASPSLRNSIRVALGHSAPRGVLNHQIVASRLEAVRGQATHPLAGVGSGGVIRHPCLQQGSPKVGPRPTCALGTVRTKSVHGHIDHKHMRGVQGWASETPPGTSSLSARFLRADGRDRRDMVLLVCETWSSLQARPPEDVKRDSLRRCISDTQIDAANGRRASAR